MTPPGDINQLALIIVSGFQAGELTQRLTQSGFYLTKIDSSGGVIQEPTVCILIGLSRERLPALIELIHACCQPHRQYIPTNMNIQPGYTNYPMIEAQIGGALVYLMNVERFEQL